MGKRGARGTSKQAVPSALNAASSPEGPWLSQLDASGSEGSEPYSESESGVTASDVEDSGDRGDAAPLSRRIGSSQDGGASVDSDGASSDEELDAAVVDVLQHADPIVMPPQTDAAAAEDALCVLLSCWTLRCTSAGYTPLCQHGATHKGDDGTQG